MKKTDADYVKSAPSLLSYWFVDCVYYGFTQDLKFDFNYTDPDNIHVVEALVVADFTPLLPTTTVKPSTTTKATTTTSKPTTTTPTTTKPTTKTTTTTSKPSTATTTIKPNVTTVIPPVASISMTTAQHLVKREVTFALPMKNSTSKVMVKVNGTLVPYNGSFPYICNNTQVTVDPTKSYGYFTEVIDVKGEFA